MGNNYGQHHVVKSKYVELEERYLPMISLDHPDNLNKNFKNSFKYVKKNQKGTGFKRTFDYISLVDQK